MQSNPIMLDIPSSSLLSHCDIDMLNKTKRILTSIVDGSAYQKLPICDHIRMAFMDFQVYSNITKVFKLWWQDWDQFSGHVNYPVPDSDHNRNDPIECFNELNFYEGEYGKSRILLAQFLLNRLQVYLHCVRGCDNQTVEYYDKVRELLIDIKRVAVDPQDHRYKRSGICSLIGECTKVAFAHPGNMVGLRVFRAYSIIIEMWPYHSGIANYPVPGTDHGPFIEFHKAKRERNFYAGEYGQLRLLLIDYLLNVTEWIISTCKVELSIDRSINA